MLQNVTKCYFDCVKLRLSKGDEGNRSAAWQGSIQPSSRRKNIHIHLGYHGREQLAKTAPFNLYGVVASVNSYYLLM
jgi:hypothetical protein